MVSRNKFLLLLAMLAVVVISVSFVSAVTSVQIQGVFNRTRGNVTSTTPNIEFTCYLADYRNVSATGYNVSLYYNATGGSVGHSTADLITSRATRLLTIWNKSSFNAASANIYNFTNLTVSLASLSDRLRGYNFSCLADNGTGQVFSDGIYNVTKFSITHGANINITSNNGTDAVNGFLIYNSSRNAHNAYGNFSNNFTVNVTVQMTIGDIRADPFGYLDAVYFNLSKNGVQELFTRAHGGDDIPHASFAGFNMTYDSHNGSFADALQGYQICIYANDSLGNINATECSTITIDNHAPSVTLSQVTADTTTDSIKLTIAPGETGAGVRGSCTTDRGTVSSLSITASNLNCGESYSFKVTCTDYMNLGGSKTQSFSTNDCSGSAAGGGAGGATVVTGKTYSATDEQFKTGYTKQVKLNDQIKIKVGVLTHSIKATSVAADKVTLTISSNPITATLNIGDERKFDIDVDGSYDTLVKLNSITSGAADLTVRAIDEKVTTETEAAEKAKEETAAAEAAAEEEAAPPSNLTWLWIILAVVVIIVIVYFVMKKKRK